MLKLLALRAKLYDQSRMGGENGEIGAIYSIADGAACRAAAWRRRELVPPGSAGKEPSTYCAVGNSFFVHAHAYGHGDGIFANSLRPVTLAVGVSVNGWRVGRRPDREGQIYFNLVLGGPAAAPPV